MISTYWLKCILLMQFSISSPPAPQDCQREDRRLRRPSGSLHHRRLVHQHSAGPQASPRPCVHRKVATASGTTRIFTFPPIPQPTLTLDKDALSEDRPSRTPRPHRKKPKQLVEPELTDSDEYADFTTKAAEFTAVIVGDETETSSAVQSIQQVHLLAWTYYVYAVFTNLYLVYCV